MSIATPFRRVWRFFNKPRGPSAKSTLSRIQRRARDLMTLADLAGFCAVVWWLMIAGTFLMLSAGRSSDASNAQSLLAQMNLMPEQPANAWLLALTWLLTLIATMAPIVCLRRLGKALYTQPPLSLVVAQRFHWLGHALAANICIGIAASWLAASQLKDYELTFSLGFLGTFIAATMAYVVAEMIREGARAAEENREFV